MVLVSSLACVYAIPITDVKYLTSAEGLSSHRVFTIIEDGDGAVWISTKAGVDRYNGHEIKNYTLVGDFYYGDMAARMIQLYQDANGEIWAYDNTGRIYKYSRIHDRFDIEQKLGDAISGNIMLNKYIKSKGGKDIFGLTKGLYVKNENREIELLLADVDVNDIAEVEQDLFIGTTSGLLLLIKGKYASMITPFENKNIQTLFYDKEENELLIGTFNDGLWMMDLDTQKAVHVNSENEIFTNPIRSILKLNPNTVAIGIDGSGIYTIDRNSNCIDLLINSEDTNEYSLYGNGIYTMQMDRQGNLWAGSYTGGVSLLTLADSPSKLITHKRGNSQSLANNNVNAVAENVNGDIWYATDRGVSIFQSRCSRWIHTLQKSVGVTLCPSGNGNMVLGTYGEGIFVLDKNGNVLRCLNKQSGDLTSNCIFSIKKDNTGDYWVGALDGDLMNLDGKGKLKQTYPITLVFSTAVIDNSRIAAATVDGFYLIDKNDGTTEHYACAQEQMPHNVSAYIIPMLFNEDGSVWLGTEGGGLNLYNPIDRKILLSYKVTDGLPSNDIYSLQRDSLGRIWVSTGNGIAVINDSVVSSLNYLNGVEQEYNKSSSTMLSCGDFIFGSTSGAVRFSPTDINMVDYKAPLRITGFVIDGIDEAEKDRLMPYIYTGLKEEKIQLSYNHKSFAVNFESINLRYQEDIAYRYILEGYDNSWNECGLSGVAVYKNVAPGKYILRLCSVRKCDGKIIDEKQVKIAVSRPWWSSWWAWMLYGLLIVLTGYFIFRYKWYQLQKRNHEDKIRFFINTAHDIRTPLTLAMAPLEDLQKEEKLSPNGTYLLSVARQNIRKLNTITSRFLEFEKIDSGNHLLKPITIDLRHILQEEVGCFQNLCDKKNISLSLVLPETPACISGDSYLLEMMFDNLMSNACKYTPAGGFVKIVLTTTKNKVMVEIKDSGIGIPANEHKHIFSDIHRARNARESQEPGTGFGLLQVKRITKMLKGNIAFRSVEGEGTTFSVSFGRVYADTSFHTRQATFSDPAEAVWSIIDPMQGTPVGDKSVTILIVEDNDDLRHYLSKIFSPQYNVVTMSTADNAQIYLKTAYPDLIISDVMMPGTQGDDFCRAIKDNPETSGIPVILLTAKSNHDSIVSGLQKGADDYVAKPFNTEILKLKAKGLIENRNRLRDFLLKQAVVQVVPDKQDHTSNKPVKGSDELELSENDRDFMVKVTEIIIQNLSDTEFNIDTLCMEMAMSRTLFYSRLKSLTGKAPQEFIRILRLERAADLLRQNVSVTEVAEATGFVNVKYFSTIFKKQFGVQPSRFAIEETINKSI